MIPLDYIKHSWINDWYICLYVDHIAFRHRLLWLPSLKSLFTDHGSGKDNVLGHTCVYTEWPAVYNMETYHTLFQSILSGSRLMFRFGAFLQSLHALGSRYLVTLQISCPIYHDPQVVCLTLESWTPLSYTWQYIITMLVWIFCQCVLSTWLNHRSTANYRKLLTSHLSRVKTF